MDTPLDLPPPPPALTPVPPLAVPPTPDVTRLARRTLRWVDIAIIFGLFVIVEAVIAPGFAHALFNVGRLYGLGMRRFPVPIIAQIVVQEVLTLLVVALFVVGRGLSLPDLGFRATPYYWYLAGIGLSFVVLPIRIIAGLLAQVMVGGGLDTLTPVDDGTLFPLIGHPALAGVAIVLLAAVLVPLTEEIVFRGVFYAWLRKRMGITPAVLISSALFGFIHGSIAMGVAVFMMGIVLALAYEYSRSLWVPLVLHGLNNGVLLSLVFFALGVQEISRFGGF